MRVSKQFKLKILYWKIKKDLHFAPIIAKKEPEQPHSLAIDEGALRDEETVPNGLYDGHTVS